MMNKRKSDDPRKYREYIKQETHWVWGKRYQFSVVEQKGSPVVDLQTKKLILRIGADTDIATRSHFLKQWYRNQLRAAAYELVGKWETRLRVKAASVFVRAMDDVWGSCNPQKRTIRLNAALVHKSPDCLEYIIVHELAHLIEQGNDHSLTAVLHNALPNWEAVRDHLNQSTLTY